MEKTMDDVAKATLQQFNAAHKRIVIREEKMESLQKVADETAVAAAKNSSAKREIKDLRDENEKDRTFVKQAMEFYDEISDEQTGVGVGDLFTQGEGDHEA